MSDLTGASRSDAERNRRMLLEAAADAVARDPNASMAEVARAASLTRATLYRHFSSRQELLEAMRAEALLCAADAIAASRLDQGTAVEALRRVVDALVAEGARFRALLAEGVDQEPGFLRERTKVLAPLRDVVRRGQAAGEIRADLPPEWVLAAIASMLTAGVRMSPILAMDERAVAALLFSTLVDGVGTR